MLALAVILYVIRCKSRPKWGKIAVPIALAFYVVLIAIVCAITVRYAKDLKYVQQHEYLQIEGTAIGYAKSTSTDELTVHHSWPIFKDDVTQKEMSLNILNSDQRIKIGEHYTVIYLPNTKLAEIVE